MTDVCYRVARIRLLLLHVACCQEEPLDSPSHGISEGTEAGNGVTGRAHRMYPVSASTRMPTSTMSDMSATTPSVLRLLLIHKAQAPVPPTEDEAGADSDMSSSTSPADEKARTAVQQWQRP